MEMSDFLKHETDFYIRTRESIAAKVAKVIFKHPTQSGFPQHEYDWYLTVALEKADKVSADRHLLTRELLLSYRWAIREGYNHQLDPSLKNRFDYPNNRNTIKGIQGYIDRIKRASDQEVAGNGKD